MDTTVVKFKKKIQSVGLKALVSSSTKRFLPIYSWYLNANGSVTRTIFELRFRVLKSLGLSTILIQDCGTAPAADLLSMDDYYK